MEALDTLLLVTSALLVVWPFAVLWVAFWDGRTTARAAIERRGFDRWLYARLTWAGEHRWIVLMAGIAVLMVDMILRVLF